MKPKLRFNNFKDDYFECRLNDITEIIKDGTHGTHENVSDGIPLLSAKDIYDNIIHILEDCRKISTEDYNKIYNNYHLKENDILMTIVGTIGRTALYKNENVAFQRSVATIRVDNINNPNYVRNYLESSNVSNQLTNMTNSSAQGGIYLNSLAKIKLSLPSKEEQLKISHFLTLLDKKIHLQSKKIEDLKLFKSYTKNQLFSNGDKNIKLKDILIKWNEKNKDCSINYVESISNKYGFISQNDQFEDRNVASKDLKNYYVIRKNVFGYNPSRLNVGSLALKENDNTSVVSPLYECFTTTQNNKFMLEWFNSKFFKKGTLSKFEGGVRNTLNFTNLCEIEINLPNLDKQNKYASYLYDFDKKIQLEKNKLDKLFELKKGLMQNIFV